MVQAKDIPDDRILYLIPYEPRMIGGWIVAKALPEYPEKVVQAKLRSLLKRRLIHGCGCGCRGDWHRKKAE